MVEVEENLYIIGGDSDDDTLKKIHKLTCVSGSCSWSTLTQQLKEERMLVVAIPVMESFCKSNWVNKTPTILDVHMIIHRGLKLILVLYG